MPLEAIVPSKHCLPSREFAERANEYGGEVNGKQASIRLSIFIDCENNALQE